MLAPTARAGTVLAPDDDAGLLALFDDPVPRPSTGAHVRAVMLGSLDGAATGADGLSGSLSDAADRRVFATLRALADVVLVGAGTVRTEGYQDIQVPERLRHLRAARGRAERVELAVVTGTGDVPPAVLEAGALVVTSSDAPHLAGLRDLIGDDRLVLADGAPAPGRATGRSGVDLTAAVRALAARGLGRVHAEGGPHLFRDLVAADLVDELSLTLAPVLVGQAWHSLAAGPPGRSSAADAPVQFPTRLTLVHLLRAGDTLLGRWRIA